MKTKQNKTLPSKSSGSYMKWDKTEKKRERKKENGKENKKNKQTKKVWFSNCEVYFKYLCKDFTYGT